MPDAAWDGDRVVGAACCREEPVQGTADVRVYIMTLGCLARYRRRGLGVLLPLGQGLGISFLAPSVCTFSVTRSYAACAWDGRVPRVAMLMWGAVLVQTPRVYTPPHPHIPTTTCSAGTRLLANVIARATGDPRVTRLQLHVQISNTV
jgi:hypothetical protein